jgi:Holliday junction resolvase RusA-like endonuclease
VPVSYSKKRRESCLSNDEKPIKKPDADNVAKAFLDSMNGIVYLDDCQVTQLFVKKTYESIAKVHVLVKEDLE